MFASIITSTPAPEPSLPVFSTSEARFRKDRDTNTLIFSIPTRSSLLLPLLNPPCHAYVKTDARCLHLLQAVALVPSCKHKKLLQTVNQALKMPLSQRKRSYLEEKLRPILTRLHDEDKETSSTALLALQLKEKVAECIRSWIADPIEGFVLRKEHVVNGMRLDDLVATPAGAGYLRGYRNEDGFCIVLYPWGYGFVHIKDVDKFQKALEKHLKKRSYNEYVALEHQHLYEQIEEVLETLPEPKVTEEMDAKNENVEEYKELLKSLEEEHIDISVLQKDAGLLRRVYALTQKVKEIRRKQSQEPEFKYSRIDENEEERIDEAVQNQEHETFQDSQEQKKSLEVKETKESDEEKQGVL